jgi:hypothetical protein
MAVMQRGILRKKAVMHSHTASEAYLPFKWEIPLLCPLEIINIKGILCPLEIS